MLAADAPQECPEARLGLLELSKRRFGGITPERIVDHVMAVTPGADYPLRRAALEALMRRYGFAERDELRIDKRPPNRAILGTYRTKSLVETRRGKPRPYATALLSLEPLRTSCSCADFVRSSLGLCKHGLVVLEALEKRGVLARAKVTSPPRSQKATVCWSAEHPLTDVVDRLDRLTYAHAGRCAPPSGMRGGKPLSGVLRAVGPRLAFIVELERRLARGTIEAEPAVLTLLAEERARAERGVHSEACVRPAMKSLASLARKLYP